MCFTWIAPNIARMFRFTQNLYMHAAIWVVESVLYESEIHFYSLRSKTHKGDKGSRGFVWKLQYTQRLKDFHKVPCPICIPGYHVELRKRGKLLHTKGKISGKFLPQTSPRFYTIRILRGCQLWQCTSQWWTRCLVRSHISNCKLLWLGKSLPHGSYKQCMQ